MMEIRQCESVSGAKSSVLVPPLVPKSRGPSLPDGRRTPGGPPRTTPTRTTSRYYCRRWHSVGERLPSSEEPQVARLIPKAANGGSTAWGEKSSIADSPSSFNFETVSEPATLHGDRASIVFELEPGTDSGSKRLHMSAPTGSEDHLRGTPDAMKATPLPGVLTPRTIQRSAMPNPVTATTRSSPSRSPLSLRFHLVDHPVMYGDDDDADSLPSALPPPKPYPTVEVAAASQYGVNGTKLRLYGNVMNNTLVSPRGMSNMRGTPNMYTEGTVEKGVNPYTTSIEVGAPPQTLVSAPSPPPYMLNTPVQSLLNEVNAWVDVIHSVEDKNCYKLYLGSTEKALHDTQGEMKALATKHKLVDKELHAAKACHVERLDGNQARKKPVAQVKDAENKANTAWKRQNEEEEEVGEEKEMTREEEEWRLEKGLLLAEKALLLQKRKELCYHLRRGTNIKNVAALALSGRSSWSRSDGSANDTVSENTAPSVSDLETIQLRLELKEAQVQLMKLVDSHRILQGAQRTRTKEFEDEFVGLCHSANSAKQETECHRGTLEATLRKAEQLLEKCQQKNEESLLLLLEQRVEEARAALRPRDDKLLINDGFRSRMPSIGRCSSTGSTARRVSGASVSPAFVMPKTTAKAEQNSLRANVQ
ncbi:Flagellum attachment zone protein 13 [Trypanosoma cruzi]|uniref:Flagellum attachment zone protein 13 n=2 Tax=Trypanosoma cruzi TaxID=5693 RepID=Q4DK59_TRYCC|nr:hypothetical protein, conserved [Trypanosoma cruzi]EAN92915.1 hypothetical protein, conserved [Trypanosoma cruzi]PWV08174.1 Flagellum attachment zone protein 13 [Trypanosoma cruzi]RNC58482.1 hypothetical protein TcCL_ESM03946 [Trypanosoma cruzi]|eukprot:XP_814766.1 hypothetical protein [Trypanosoma cruzi strain CL Brener]